MLLLDFSSQFEYILLFLLNKKALIVAAQFTLINSSESDHNILYASMNITYERFNWFWNSHFKIRFNNLTIRYMIIINHVIARVSTIHLFIIHWFTSTIHSIFFLSHVCVYISLNFTWVTRFAVDIKVPRCEICGV